MVDCFKPDSAAFGAIVLVEGERVPKSMWANVKPKIGTNVVINIVPQGGGGKKNPIASLLSIALLVAAPYISSFIAGAVLEGTSLAALYGLDAAISIAGTIGTIGAGLVSVVGSLLINALAPPPKPRGLTPVDNPAESPTQFIEGARNTISAYGVVPMNLGTNRMFPPQAARPYTETVGNDQFVRQLFCWGYGDLLLSNLKIGETNITQFEDVQLEHKLAGNMSEGVALFPNDVQQDDYSVVIKETDGWTVRTTAQDVDEAIVDLTFARGLAEFNTQGKRIAREVQFEMQYATYGVSPQVWSVPAATYKSVAQIDFTPAAVPTTTPSGFGQTNTSYRKDIITIDKLSGVISYTKATGIGTSAANATPPVVPSTAHHLATVTVKSSVTHGSATVTTSFTLEDKRDPALFGTRYEDSNSFVPSIVSGSVRISAGGLSADPMYFKEAQTEALRRSTQIKFPARGQYDIRVRRITPDSDDDQIFDEAALTAIRNITYRKPVNLVGVSGTAVRMRGSEQLNGALDELNGLLSTQMPDYDPGAGQWLYRPTSNPASLLRAIWQNVGDGTPNARPLPDEKIDIEALEDWAEHCINNGYTYNRVIDYVTSVDDVVRDICSAGAAAPDIVDGKRTIVIDRIKPRIAQVITPRNSWGYSGVMTYPDLPHAFRTIFRNAAKNFLQDERMVYDDGYSEFGEVPGTVAATKFEELQLPACTNADLAFKTARRHIASARLRPETHTFMLDVENLVALRGDRIKLAHDAPIVGVGDGRIKSVILNNDSPQMVTGIVIDDTVTIPSNGDYYVRVRLADGETLYKELRVAAGDYSTFNFATPFLAADAPEVGDLCYFVEAGGELDLIITRIEPQGDLTARITAVNYDERIFEAENAPIPAFDSKITTPLSLVRPVAPVVTDVQSDESVMTRNSDGSYTSRMVINLQNDNDGAIATSVQIRQTGSDNYASANVLEATPERVVLTGLQDGTAYDLAIRYRRVGSNQMSPPTLLNGYIFVGASNEPDDVTGFMVQITEGQANFKWTPNDDIDISHYKMKFAKVFSGGSWATAQVLEDNIENTRLTTTFQPGTYFIKAVDILGNESVNATSIITFTDAALRNVVETITEDPDFGGVKDNVALEGESIVLGDTELPGIYYFEDTVDLGAVFTSYISAAVNANGAYVNNLFDFDDLLLEDDIFGQLGGDIVAAPDLFLLDDLFGIGENGWSIQLQYRISQGSATDSPPAWGPWQEFAAGNLAFRSIQFRVLMESNAPSVTPQIKNLSVTIDMPDRVEADNDLVVPVTGLRVDFSPPFKKLDGLSIVAQDLAPGDVAEVTNKDQDGFDIIFRNDVGGAVERTFDYVAKGYGRETV